MSVVCREETAWRRPRRRRARSWSVSPAHAQCAKNAADRTTNRGNAGTNSLAPSRSSKRPVDRPRGIDTSLGDRKLANVLKLTVVEGMRAVEPRHLPKVDRFPRKGITPRERATDVEREHRPLALVAFAAVFV